MVYVKILLGIITFHVIKVNIPFLFCLVDMDKLGMYLNNTINRLV
jgi:hypothetical protein